MTQSAKDKGSDAQFDTLNRAGRIHGVACGRLAIDGFLIQSIHCIHSLHVFLVATFALFRLPGTQASIALAEAPNVDAITARCGACSSSRFLCRRCLFARSCSLWLFVAWITNSSPHPLLHNKHPAANPALITILNDGLVGLVFFAKLTGSN